MIDPLSAYTLALALAVAACCSLAFVGFSRRYVSGAAPFSFLMVASSIYALGMIFEVRGVSAAELQFWLSIEYVGIVFIGPLWLLLALTVSGHRSVRFSALVVGFFSFSAIILALVWTNDRHHLYYKSVELVRRGPFSVSALGKGSWYWINMVTMNGCVLAANCVLLARAARAPASYRSQAVLMFIASLFPWAGMFLYLSGLTPYGLDFAPVGIALSGLFFSWCLFRRNFLDVGLIAYERIFEGMREGVLVLDRRERVIGANPSMLRILGATARDCVGARARDILAGVSGLAGLLEREPPAETDVRFLAEGAARHFEAKITAIAGRGGRRLGSILSLSDITLRVELTDKLAALATVDELTGVANRRAFIEAAGRELHRSRRQGFAGIGPDPRPRRVQEDQRQPRPRGGRRGPQGGGGDLRGPPPRDRSLLPLRRGGIRRPPARPGARRGGGRR